MTDKFENVADSEGGSSRAPYAVTPHDTNALSPVPKRLYVGTGGDVALRGLEADADVVYVNVPSGGYIFVRAEFVRATGTTAEDIVAEA